MLATGDQRFAHQVGGPTIFRPWLGWFGLFGAAVHSFAQLELIATVIDDFPDWEQAGLIGSLLWLAWMLIIDVRLVTTKTFPTSASG